MNNSTPYKINILNLGRSDRRQVFCDRFQLQIPYMPNSDLLTLQLFFDGTKPHAPCDFQIVSSLTSSYVQNFMLDQLQLKSLSDWRDCYNQFKTMPSVIQTPRMMTNGHSILQEMSTFTYRTISEILDHFTSYFQTVISRHPCESIKFEYSTTSEIPGVRYYIKEIGNGKEISEQALLEYIYFSIPLQIKGLDRIEEYQQLFSPETLELPDSNPKLTITYCYDRQRGNISNVTTELEFPEPTRNNKRLEWLTQIPAPVWSLGKSCIIEYLPMVTEKIEVEVARAYSKIQSKMDFLTGLLKTFGNPTDFAECDSTIKITFLCDHEKFQFFLHISLHKENFPKEIPIVRMQSAQLLKSTEKVSSQVLPIRVRIPSLNWNEQGSMEQNVENVRVQICSFMDEFKKVCETIK